MSYRQPLFTALMLAFVSISTISLTSCGGEAPATIELASVAPAKIADTKENDKRFLTRAIEMNFEQILIAKLAGQRTSSDQIRTFARTHEAVNREEKSTLASLGIYKSIPVPSVPTQSAQAAYDTLNLASVEEFDVAYIHRVMEGYNLAIAHFESVANSNIDPDIKAKAQAMLPALRAHLSEAAMLNGAMNPVSELTE